MSDSNAPHSPEDIARRGDEIYERNLRSRLEPDQLGKIVAIDIESGDHAVADTALEAARDLRTRQPDAEVWLIRIGERGLHRIGVGSRGKGMK
ncbi:MAG TPA: hypothetical protein VLA12_23510, partial [Planctomycetaceae bacterium]|nr:hypothetical protein [Planctomycetaceae bacterium]